MELKRLLRSALALALTAAALAGPLAAPASKTSADTEFDLDGTAFTEPEYDTGIMYFWHRGVPTVTKDKGGNYIKYPVIITWAGQYYLCTDASFTEELNETHKKQEKKNGHHKYIGNSSDWNVIGGDGYEKWDRVWGNTDYYMRYLYDMSSSALITKLDMDINSLKTLGEAVSMKIPDGVPYLVATKPETNQYAIGLNEKAFGQNVWLVGVTRTWEWIYTHWLYGYDEDQCGDVQWSLDYEGWKAEQFLDKNYVYSGWRSMYDCDSHQSYNYKEGPDQRNWTIKQDSEGLYHIWTTGENLNADFGRLSGSVGPSKNRDRTRDWFHANDVGRMSLYFSGSQIGVSAETIAYKDWKDRQCTVDNTDGYTVYYGDPNIVTFHKKDFTVVSGQVVNLDGPRVIDKGCTVTVKEGGVLACEGWVINNGQILVEPGGLLILTERETATGDRQYGAITSVGLDPTTHNGRIACDGTIIINRDCKLTCAGTYGLQLGEGAQVVNYGQIITENLEVYVDHTIENRGDTSAVFAGWGITDSGYAITRTQISGQSYNAKGTLQKAAFVTMPRDAVYGDGASHLYVNPASSVTYTVRPGNYNGYVSGYVVPLDLNDDAEPLPASYPIYMDDRYDVAFITVNNVIYQYDAMVGRWVNIAEGGHETFFNYRMSDKMEDYLQGKLPDGFILSDGRVVGQAVNESQNLHYDVHAHVYWFIEDTVDYYYEEALGAYIHVEMDDTYFRYPKDLAPPPSYDSDHVPSSMYQDVDMNVRFYSAGMAEIQVSDVKPKVQKDETGYYIVVRGYRLDWSKPDQLFADLAGALPDKDRYDSDGKLLGIPVDMVNLNGYNPNDDPSAKPKVQVGEYGYYIIYEGNYYLWYAKEEAFINGTPDRYLGDWIRKDQVDLNGYSLDAVAKPKVQKDKDGYYIIYEGNTYRWNKKYQMFENESVGIYIHKNEVDLNGYTLP